MNILAYKFNFPVDIAAEMCGVKEELEESGFHVPHPGDEEEANWEKDVWEKGLFSFSIWTNSVYNNEHELDDMIVEEDIHEMFDEYNNHPHGDEQYEGSADGSTSSTTGSTQTSTDTVTGTTSGTNVVEPDIDNSSSFYATSESTVNNETFEITQENLDASFETLFAGTSITAAGYARKVSANVDAIYDNTTEYGDARINEHSSSIEENHSEKAISSFDETHTHLVGLSDAEIEALKAEVVAAGGTWTVQHEQALLMMDERATAEWAEQKQNEGMDYDDAVSQLNRGDASITVEMADAIGIDGKPVINSQYDYEEYKAEKAEAFAKLDEQYANGELTNAHYEIGSGVAAQNAEDCLSRISQCLTTGELTQTFGVAVEGIQTETVEGSQQVTGDYEMTQGTNADVQYNADSTQTTSTQTTTSTQSSYVSTLSTYTDDFTAGLVQYFDTEATIHGDTALNRALAVGQAILGPLWDVEATDTGHSFETDYCDCEH
ncbi:hypothetical protein J6A31_02590 [bacterium]|nr:hypothetical protein [bacterium]